jgi:hypothetical protein
MNNINLFEEAKSAYEKFSGKGKILGISFSPIEELKNFSQEQKEIKAYNNSYLGIQNIPLDKIVGSVQKNEDFKMGFIPKNNIVKTRWCNIYMEMLGDGKLPPINLYKIRDEYYVYDGNHRVSVANYLNFVSIEAEVTEFFSGEGTEEELKYRGKFEFLKTTKLDIELSNGDDYRKILRDIKEVEEEDNIEEKARFWKFNIFNPIITILKFNDLIGEEELDGDAYIKFFSHRMYLINNMNQKGYLYGVIDYMNMRYLKEKYTLNTQIKMNYYIETIIKKLYKFDQERYIEDNKKKKLMEIRKYISGDFLDELYFSENIKEEIKIWYFEKVKKRLDYFESKISNKFNLENLFDNKLKLYRELESYIDYYQEKYVDSTFREGILDYILEIYLPILDYITKYEDLKEQHQLVNYKNKKKESLDKFFKLSHRKIKFLKNGKDINLEELENLYDDLGEKIVTLGNLFTKRLKKETTFKGDILKSVRELLLIKGQDVEGFDDLMELYQGTTNYQTVTKIKEEIWKFVEENPTGNWVHDKFQKDLENLLKNQEGVKFFKTERFMHHIKEKSDTYTFIDFYVDYREEV